ncbi:uncharacterized protein NECHADRAFT_86746 [Fusarium vanettenii 77-13-4]|uniref:Uncharacterized protein n=1 Tax=Fusarium vanettenii (strain ATCC MYA-4622 / CBS 123669 / FGSC 9596 / NRRL 45880 / 77-13-4) TaxID=660122 RepID=C7ZFW2_FUSV7|nr:uncharacterized protein NECHADRAFT_86746 [Fusarium vanettenii 77-13-4]EEU37047.1 predicted protein [Fusarium vanettenii 77-13-4]
MSELTDLDSSFHPFSSTNSLSINLSTMVRNAYNGFGDNQRGRGAGGFGRRGSGRGAPQGAKYSSNQSRGPSGQQQHHQQQQQPQQGQPAPKKRARQGTREEAEENLEYWREQGTKYFDSMKHYERKFKEAAEKIAEWTLKRDALPEVPEAKVELEKEVEKMLAEKEAEKQAEKATEKPAEKPAESAPEDWCMY